MAWAVGHVDENGVVLATALLEDVALPLPGDGAPHSLQHVDRSIKTMNRAVRNTEDSDKQLPV